MVRKKRGSSLLMVIMVFAILSIAGTSVVSMTSNDYYRRINETQRLENLYGAESGLDITYNVLAKNFESAVAYGNLAVVATLKNSTATTSVEAEKERVKNGESVLYKKDGLSNDSKIINRDGTLNTEGYSDLEQRIFQENFKSFILFTLEETLKDSKIITVTSEITNYDSIDNLPNDPNISNLDELQNSNIIVVSDVEDLALNDTTIKLEKFDGKKENNDITNDVEEMNKFSIEITSQYEPVDENARKIRAAYTIHVPEYQYYIESTEIEMPIHPLFNKTIAVDGDMDILSNTDISGDVFVVGSNNLKNVQINSVTNSHLYDKYNGGVSVSGTAVKSTNFELKGSLVTSNSVKVKEHASMNSNENIFASSVALGKTSDVESDYKSVVFKNNVISGEQGLHLSNDLSINGNNIKAEITNFYGINDIKDSNKAVNSSSIIINSNENGTLDIDKRAYIWGTAYINTANQYQTGESVAIKGNYLAYSDSLEKDVEFVYDKPLQLISKIDGKEATVFEKSEHIKEYYEKNKDNLNLVGVTLPLFQKDIPENSINKKYPEGTYTVGAYISDNKIENPAKDNIAEIEKDYVSLMQRDFMDEVYYMGIAKNLNKTDEKLGSEFPLNPTMHLTIKSEIAFSNLINKNEIDIDGNRIIFNNDPNKTITLSGDKISGLIITAGNIEVTGDIEFTGTIIAGGNIICKDGDIKVKEDINLVRNIVAKNYIGHLENVIENRPNLPTEKIKVELEEFNDVNTKFPVKDFIKKGNWKIETPN